MKALIFAAGLGTRLRPLTDNRPKALVPICGRPLLQILVEKLRDEGFSELVVNVHHFAQMIKDYLHENDNFGIDIRISDETDMLLETGGGVKKAAPLFTHDDAPFLIHNVDILSNLPLGEFLASATQRTVEYKGIQPQQINYLLFNHDNMLVGWTNTTTGEVKSPYPDLNPTECKRYAFSGIHVFSPSLLPLMEPWKGKFSIIDFYLSVCDRVPIYAEYSSTLQLLDVGKLDSIALAERFIEDSKVF